jgi:hypothetical protein
MEVGAMSGSIGAKHQAVPETKATVKITQGRDFDVGGTHFLVVREVQPEWQFAGLVRVLSLFCHAHIISGEQHDLGVEERHNLPVQRRTRGQQGR